MANNYRLFFTHFLTFSISDFLINNLKTLALQVRYSYITLKALTVSYINFVSAFFYPCPQTVLVVCIVTEANSWQAPGLIALVAGREDL